MSNQSQMENSKEIRNNIKQEPEENSAVTFSSVSRHEKCSQQFSKEIIDNIKQEPEEHFILTLPEVSQESVEEQQSDVEEFVLKCNHNQKFHNERRCDLCDLSFSCKICKSDHITRDHRKGSKWKCTKCHVIKDRRDRLQSHILIHFKTFLCETCFLKFSLQEHLKRHQLKQRHGVYATMPITKIECKLCTSSFATWIGYRKHLRFVHSKNESRCDVCDKNFKNLPSIRRHMQIHIKTPCPICGHMMATHRLHIHMNQHMSAEKYKCDSCIKAFSSQIYLNKHKTRVHKFGKFQCDQCNRIFKNKDCIRTHILNHIKIPCRICGRKVGKPHLNQHMKSHVEIY